MIREARLRARRRGALISIRTIRPTARAGCPRGRCRFPARSGISREAELTERAVGPHVHIVLEELHDLAEAPFRAAADGGDRPPVGIELRDDGARRLDDQRTDRPLARMLDAVGRLQIGRAEFDRSRGDRAVGVDRHVAGIPLISGELARRHELIAVAADVGPIEAADVEIDELRVQADVARRPDVVGVESLDEHRQAACHPETVDGLARGLLDELLDDELEVLRDPHHLAAAVSGVGLRRLEQPLRVRPPRARTPPESGPVR